MEYIIYLNAGNDNNGNPRRAYVLMRNGIIVKAWPEGYQGYNAVSEEYRDAAHFAMSTPIPTTPKYYREVIKQYRNI